MVGRDSSMKLWVEWDVPGEAGEASRSHVFSKVGQGRLPPESSVEL